MAKPKGKKNGPGRRKELLAHELMTPPELAYMIGVDPKTLKRWADRNLITKAQRRMYWASEVFTHALENDGVVSSNNKDEDKSKEELRHARAVYERAKAKVAQAEVDIEKQRLLLVDDVKGQLIHVLTVVKRELMIMPRTLPTALYGMTKEESKKRMKTMLDKIYDTVLKDTELLLFKKTLRKQMKRYK